MEKGGVVEAWTEFEKSMDKEPFLVSTLVNKACFATTLVDTGCTSYGLIDSRFATKHNLQRIPITPRGVTGFDAPSGAKISEVAVISMDIDGHIEDRAFMYVVP
jgi:predicted aspartyl protease